MSRTVMSRTVMSRTVMSRTVKSRTVKSRTVKNRTVKSRAVAGVLAAGVVAGIVVTASGPASAAPSRNGSTAIAAASPTVATAATTGPTGMTLPSRPVCTPAVFGQAQQRVEANLAARLSQLDALQRAVGDSANHLTSGDRQTLQNDITTVELPGIEALQPQVQEATTCAQLLRDAHSMVFDYRVFVVMTPQTHLTIVADDETYVEGQLVSLEPAIARAIQNAQAQGKNVTAAQAAFTDLKGQVSAAQGATGGRAVQVLAQTPSGYPGNWPVFLTTRTDLVNARNDLHSAYTDARQIRADLQ